MKQHVPALIPIVPLFAALIAPLVAYLSRKAVRFTSIVAILIAHICSVIALYSSLVKGTWHYYFGNWTPPWGIEYVIDPLAGGMATLISFISLLVAFYAGPHLKEEAWLRKGIFYALYLLITTGLLGMVITGDMFNLYVFLEISSISAYALIAFGGKRASVAAFRYLLVGTIAASFYLLGIGYLYAVTGTLNMADLAEKIQLVMGSRAALMGLVMIVVGMALKMALFPMHGWLPDAYTYAPAPVIPFISGVMTKVSAYVLLRMTLFVLGAMTGPVSVALQIMGWLAAAGIVAGSIMAIAQQDFRRMLAYSSVAQIGYIVLGISLGNSLGLIGALLHILNHGVMKCCLFLVAGGIKWRTGEHSIPKLIEMSKKMPLTMGAFLIAAFSMIGLPPTAGFFSKWYLVLGAIDSGMWPFVAVIILSSLLNAVYFFRIIENSYLKKRSAEEKTAESSSSLELPATMLIPIIILGVGILVLGIFNSQIVTHVLQYSLPGGGL